MNQKVGSESILSGQIKHTRYQTLKALRCRLQSGLAASIKYDCSVHLPSQTDPCRTRPTISDVH